MKQRSLEFDILKGIGILAVIIGHYYLQDFIFIWHMPLFFFVSGYFFKQKTLSFYLKNGIKQLLKPYVVTGIIILCFYILFFSREHAIAFFKDFILGNSYPNDYSVSIGPLWFLLCLFWVRIMYNYLKLLLDNSTITIVLFSILTLCVFSGKIVLLNKCPYMLVTTIPALLFFHFGALSKPLDLPKVLSNNILVVVIISGIILTVILIHYPYMNISLMRLPLYPLCIINAMVYIILLIKVIYI